MKNISSMIQGKSHVLWDFNGTLLDDAHLCVKSVNVLLTEAQLPVITLADYHQKFTFPVRDYYKDLGFDMETADFAALSEQFHDLYHSWLDEAEIFPGTFEVLQELAHLNHHVLSAANIHDLHRMIDKFGLKPHFKSVYGLGDRLAHSKVELGRELLRTQELDPRECVMFGDTLHDLEVGEALGLDVILVTGGHQHVDRLKTRAPRIWTRGG
ncbi:MAG: HAD family hydrolase [Bdellovibrionaceae bacterium]|nr:HAD family hydrolase [Pseudobdellovibrionaceae bacterium]